MVSWKPVFLVQGSWQRFATEREARDSAHARFMVWTMPSDWSAEESEDPVNYKRVEGRDVPI